MNITVIGNSETVTGFALIGVKNLFEVSSNEEAYEVYMKTESPVIILSTQFSEIIEQKRKDDKIIVKVSKEQNKGSKNDVISKLVREVLGFEINI